MLRIDPNNVIHLTRGDTAYFTISIKGNGNIPYEVKETDTVTLTIKKSTYDKESVISKNAVDGVVKLEPEDTEKMAYGTYYYDVELKTEDGDVFTVIPPAKFILGEEVTW